MDHHSLPDADDVDFEYDKILQLSRSKCLSLQQKCQLIQNEVGNEHRFLHEIKMAICRYSMLISVRFPWQIPHEKTH